MRGARLTQASPSLRQLSRVAQREHRQPLHSLRHHLHRLLPVTRWDRHRKRRLGDLIEGDPAHPINLDEKRLNRGECVDQYRGRRHIGHARMSCENSTLSTNRTGNTPTYETSDTVYLTWTHFKTTGCGSYCFEDLAQR